MSDTGRLFVDLVRFGTDRGWSSPLAISQDLLLAMSLLEVVDELSAKRAHVFPVRTHLGDIINSGGLAVWPEDEEIDKNDTDKSTSGR